MMRRYEKKLNILFFYSINSVKKEEEIWILEKKYPTLQSDS